MATLIRQAYLLGVADDEMSSVGNGVGGSQWVGPEGKGDVLIEHGRITAIAPTLVGQPDTAQIIEAEGQFLGPGLVDLYSQSGEPGHESRETHQSLRQAAAAGGFTRVGLLPNTQPAADNASAISSLSAAIRLPYQATETPKAEASKTENTATHNPVAEAQLMPWATITLGGEGNQLTELGELATAGAIGFTDARPITNPVLLRRLLEYAQPLQKPLALWPCDPKLAGIGVAREGVDALRLGLRGVSAIAETTVLTTLLECVAAIGTPVHLMRISTARSVALIRQAKADGLPISASVPWHQLLFDTQDLSNYNPNLRHDPPLGTPNDRHALIAGVADGVIDAIAIDHSPYTYEEKTVAFDATPPGAIGLEFALPLLWQTFVSTQQWSPEQLWQRLSQGPDHCLGRAARILKPNHPAELTLFDPNAAWQATPDNLHSLASNTPWLHQHIQGKTTGIWMPTACP